MQHTVASLEARAARFLRWHEWRGPAIGSSPPCISHEECSAQSTRVVAGCMHCRTPCRAALSIVPCRQVTQRTGVKTPQKTAWRSNTIAEEPEEEDEEASGLGNRPQALSASACQQVRRLPRVIPLYALHRDPALPQAWAAALIGQCLDPRPAVIMHSLLQLAGSGSTAREQMHPRRL